MIQIYEITREQHEQIYQILVNEYLSGCKDYKECENDAFNIIYNINIPKYIDNIFRMVKYHTYREFSSSFFVDLKNKKILYEGYISIKCIDHMKYADLYLPYDEIEYICEKYHLERKSDRKIKIEKLIKNEKL